ncbi:hypothetical protein GGU10DRAFT_409672 [Lentinula aff. detonsa]|uniref:Uncharacterized protein n=1 Tax=Lentinula aff. detonsa TaxID=2804958 RepID=A0AA38KUE7_9AGAR|nr:hypothetical protein GGU10DRAFT_409672 [Lentinula aff. detonsa]
MDPSTLSTVTPNNRKRNRENETPSQRVKREKAAERQRRKRERDRLGIPVNYVHPPPQRNTANTVVVSAGPSNSNEPELTPEEEARRDRVRAAARERQRKHRALIKQRKMRELGMDMGNDITGNVQVPPSSDEQGGLSYAVDTQAGFHATMISPPPPPGIVQQSISDDTRHGGQMFATTLLLSFSCAPLLKQHLLNSLQMSNEELASLEPIIADAWDQWDRQRRQQHQQPFDASQYSSQHPFVTTNSTPQDVSTASAANEFRARFHRSLVAPTPFQAQAAAAVAQAQANAAAHAAQVVQSAVSGSLNGMTEEDGGSAKTDHS